jgi:AcrR family transcriptional regulator
MQTWQTGLIVRRLAEGATFPEAADAAGVNRATVWRWCRSSPEFAQAVVVAREAGKDEREYRLWLRHPFRGLRPPSGKGTRFKPRFAWGRRGG